MFRTNENKGAVRHSQGTQIRRAIIVDEIDVLLDCQAVEDAGEEIVVVHVYDGATQAARKLEELGGAR